MKALSDKIKKLLEGLAPEERKEKIQKMIIAIEIANELEKKEKLISFVFEIVIIFLNFVITVLMKMQKVQQI
jgi:hypothetical protein